MEEPLGGVEISVVDSVPVAVGQGVGLLGEDVPEPAFGEVVVGCDGAVLE